MPKVKVIGCGPGAKGLLTFESYDAVKKSDVIYGTKRLLNLFDDLKCEKIEIKGDYKTILDKIESEYREKRISVLVTGDVGFYSFSRLIRRRLGRENCEYYSGISSVEYAFNKIMVEWSDAVFISTHGKIIDNLIDDLDGIIEKNRKIAILTNGESGVKELFENVQEETLKHKYIFVMENLSYTENSSERILKLNYQEALTRKFSSLNIVLIINKEDYEEK